MGETKTRKQIKNKEPKLEFTKIPCVFCEGNSVAKVNGNTAKCFHCLKEQPEQKS